MANRFRLVHLADPDVGFLHDIFDVARRNDA
jgi:hypothetical protein